MKNFSNDEQLINCSVYDCKHCNTEYDKCKLESINVCNCHGDGNKESTMCNSYKRKN